MSFDNLLAPFTGIRVRNTNRMIRKKSRFQVIFSVSGIAQSRTFRDFDTAQRFAFRVANYSNIDFVRGPLEVN